MPLKPWLEKGRLEAGCDEAGRGCLAGPVVAAAVILPPGFRNSVLNDSKKLSAAARQELRIIIEEKSVAWAVAFVSPQEIDAMNILNASIHAMHKALGKLSVPPEFILVDGNRFKPFGNISHSTIVQGDGKYLSIAAASILAKTHRDAYMEKLAETYPAYAWEQNKGYGTELHRQAIRENGPCDEHRKSFQLLPAQLKLDFE